MSYCRPRSLVYFTVQFCTVRFRVANMSRTSRHTVLCSLPVSSAISRVVIIPIKGRLASSQLPFGSSRHRRLALGIWYLYLYFYLYLYLYFYLYFYLYLRLAPMGRSLQDKSTPFLLTRLYSKCKKYVA